MNTSPFVDDPKSIEEQLIKQREVLKRTFWERVFLATMNDYKGRGWKDSSAACAAKDADDAVKEWDKRWGPEAAL